MNKTTLSNLVAIYTTPIHSHSLGTHSHSSNTHKSKYVIQMLWKNGKMHIKENLHKKSLSVRTLKTSDHSM